jgi:hypothetical protein
MTETTRKLLALLLAAALVASLGVATACSSSEDEGGGETTTDTNGDGEADGESEGEDDGGTEDGGGSASDAELEDGAIAISKAYFGQFSAVGDSAMADFAVATMVEDSEGNMWARVVATPSDASMETEQIYVKLEPGNDVWFAIDMGTGIDPATDDRFPEDVRDELQP